MGFVFVVSLVYMKVSQVRVCVSQIPTHCLPRLSLRALLVMYVPALADALRYITFTSTGNVRHKPTRKTQETDRFRFQKQLTLSSKKEIPLEDCVGHKENVTVFLDIGVVDRFKDELIGRVEIELFTKTHPVTTENFRCFCTGEKGEGSIKGRNMHYKGTCWPFTKSRTTACLHKTDTFRSQSKASSFIASFPGS
jgi:hypothetical protein|tara:strand:+ start:3619 stop:4203 length:585 start_codon:yes stop_codon:yes gene_type:complete